MEQKKYTDVIRLGHKTTVGVLTKGDNIIIQEKIDGSNAGFRRVGDKLIAYSRNNELHEGLTLNGFYQFVQSLNPQIFVEGYIYFGEWLRAKHKIDYSKRTADFYMFDLYDVDNECYCDYTDAKFVAELIGLTFVPIFYEGEYIDFEHLMSFVGKSDIAEHGEGIVVKNTNYRNQYGNQIYVKLVTEEFAETQKQKLPKDPTGYGLNKFVAEFLTPARVEKFMYKLVDEQFIPEDYGIELMGTILKELGSRIYDDLLKEESDNLSEEDSDEKDIKKSIGKVLPLLVKSIVLENQKNYQQV